MSVIENQPAIDRAAGFSLLGSLGKRMTMEDWSDLLAESGFELISMHRAPLRLLEPDRIIADEGVLGATRFAANVLAKPQVRRRVAYMRGAMRRNAPHRRAVAMVAVRRGCQKG